MAALASDWLRHFRLLLRNRRTEFNETLQEARSQCPLPSLCFSGGSEKTKMAALADSSKRWHIVLRCTICGPLGLLFFCPSVCLSVLMLLSPRNALRWGYSNAAVVPCVRLSVRPSVDLLNTIETTPFHVSLSNLAGMITMMRG